MSDKTSSYEDAVQAQCDTLVAETEAFVAAWTEGTES